MKTGICDKACAILRATNDGTGLHGYDIKALEHAANDWLNEQGYAKFDNLHSAVINGHYNKDCPVFDSNSKRQLTALDLQQFTGTVNHYKHGTSNVRFTDGVFYLADQGGAFWLIDAIVSYHRQETFQIWELHKNEDNTATLTMVEDTGLPVLVKQEIPYTDFPLDSIRLYLIKNVLMLPTEY